MTSATRTLTAMTRAATRVSAHLARLTGDAGRAGICNCSRLPGPASRCWLLEPPLQVVEHSKHQALYCLHPLQASLSATMCAAQQTRMFVSAGSARSAASILTAKMARSAAATRACHQATTRLAGAAQHAPATSSALTLAAPTSVCASEAVSMPSLGCMVHGGGWAWTACSITTPGQQHMPGAHSL